MPCRGFFNAKSTITANWKKMADRNLSLTLVIELLKGIKVPQRQEKKEKV